MKFLVGIYPVVRTISITKLDACDLSADCAGSESYAVPL